VIRAFTPKLFPSESGALGVLGPSRNLVEVVASWGDSPPADPLCAPDRCWALRRGRPYRVDGGGSEPVCGHLGSSPPKRYLCVPMMAHGEAMGLLHLQGGVSEPGPGGAGPRTRRRCPGPTPPRGPSQTWACATRCGASPSWTRSRGSSTAAT